MKSKNHKSVDKLLSAHQVTTYNNIYVPKMKMRPSVNQILQKRVNRRRSIIEQARLQAGSKSSNVDPNKASGQRLPDPSSLRQADEVLDIQKQI